jgi:hypothetical protein
MSVPKPLPCNQKWDDMRPVGTDHRVCLGCDKLVTDFRQQTWRTIETTHRDSLMPVCGIYTDQQLQMWGLDNATQPACSRFATLTAALLTLTPLSVAAQENPKTLISQTANNAAQATDYIAGTIIFEYANGEKEPFFGAVICVFKDGVISQKAVADFNGRFRINLDNQFVSLPDNVLLRVSSHQIQSQYFNVNKQNVNALNITIKDSTITKIKEVEITPPPPVAFYVTAPASTTLAAPVEPVRKPRKWWQFWKRKKINKH